MTEELKWFISNSWLFDENYENTEYAKVAKQLGPDALCYQEPIPYENTLSFEQLIVSLPNEEIKIILQYLSNQMQLLMINNSNGTIPWFINQLGGRISTLLEIKKQQKK